jgi:hypothetical protein
LIFIAFITLTPTLSHQGRGGAPLVSKLQPGNKVEFYFPSPCGRGLRGGGRGGFPLVPKLQLGNKKQKICTLFLRITTRYEKRAADYLAIGS